MKLKTLFAVLALLCISLFAVACGGGDDTTTADPGTQAPGTTTAATTTKKTTTKKTSNRCTTTTVTTTLAPDFLSKLPASLPEGKTYEVGLRFGMESDEEFMASAGNYGVHSFTTEGAVYGNAIKFNSKMSASGSARRGELYMTPAESFSTEGLRGVLFYIDFSDVEVNTGDAAGICASVSMNVNGFRAKAVAGVEGSGVGYYLQNGEWVTTQSVKQCRMALPEGFKGWVYIPLTSYTVNGSADASGELFDPTTGIGLMKWITNFRVYTDGYVYTDDHYVLVDEVLFVK